MTIVKKLTKNIIGKLVEEFNNIDNREKIENQIVNPIIYYISNKIYPFFLIILMLIILNFVFSCILLMIVIKLNLKFNHIIK
jgi:hypothetical protein